MFRAWACGRVGVWACGHVDVEILEERMSTRSSPNMTTSGCKTESEHQRGRGSASRNALDRQQNKPNLGVNNVAHRGGVAPMRALGIIYTAGNVLQNNTVCTYGKPP